MSQPKNEPDRWRLVITDSESLSGIAPACTQSRTDGGLHDLGQNMGDPDDLSRWDDHGVYDCCPHPHIECWTELAARPVLAALNAANAEPCS